MKLKHRGNIFCLALNQDSSRVFSGGTDEQLIIHDTERGDLVTSRFLDSAICDISMNPSNNNILAIGCENGQTTLFDCRTNLPEQVNNLLPDNSFKSIQYHPMQPHLLLVASSCEKDVNLVDLRSREIVFDYLCPFTALKGAMCARYNSLGDQILVLRNQLPVSLYNSNNPHELCEFDEFGFFNAITQKCVTFAGADDEYCAAASDDFNVYLYKIPRDLKFVPSNDSEHQIRFVNSADFVLRGHKSIVNQVTYNYQRSLLASSGVETVIKIWSPFPLNLDKEESKEHLSTTPNERPINPFPVTRPVILNQNLHDEDSNRPLNAPNEDLVVLNFFDNLIYRHFSDDDVEEFIDSSSDESAEKSFQLVDPQFDHNLRYIRSLIYDFKLNGQDYKRSMIKQLKSEQAREKSSDEAKKLGAVSSRSLSYLFNNKKIKQYNIILRRAYKLIQERLRFIRKCRKEENLNDDWLEKVQKMVDNEPALKEMLLDLNSLYKAKCRLKTFSSPLYYEIVKRLTRLFFRRGLPPFRFIPASLLDVDTSRSTDIDEAIDELRAREESDEENASHNLDDSPTGGNKTVQGIASNDNHQSTSDQANASKRSSSTESGDSDTESNSSALGLSDDSLSVGSVLNDRQTEAKTGKNLKRKKSDKSPSFKLRRKYLEKNATESKQQKKSNLFNFSLFSSNIDSDSSDDDKPIRKFKRNKPDKMRNCNAFAFDSELDLESDTTDLSSASDSDGSKKAKRLQFIHNKRSATDKLEESWKSSDDDHQSKRKKPNELAPKESGSSDQTSTGSSSGSFDEKSKDSDGNASRSANEDVPDYRSESNDLNATFNASDDSSESDSSNRSDNPDESNENESTKENDRLNLTGSNELNDVADDRPPLSGD